MHDMHLETLKRAILILMAIAARGKTITYKELALALGLPVAGLNFGERSALQRLLDLLMVICFKRELPLLPLCVVRADTGQPGEGLGPVLQALNVIKEAEWIDPIERKEMVKVEQQRALHYCQNAQNDDRFVHKALGS